MGTTRHNATLYTTLLQLCVSYTLMDAHSVVGDHVRSHASGLGSYICKLNLPAGLCSKRFGSSKEIKNHLTKVNGCVGMYTSDIKWWFSI